MPSTYLALLGKLTESERIHLLLFPEQAPIIKRAAERAMNETRQRFHGNGHNTRSDAFRHCYWSALLARDIGFGSALRYTNAHETFADNPPNEKSMDLHNNAVGLGIGRLGGADDVLVGRCLVALRAGRLKIISQ